METVGPVELLTILIVVLMLFGSKKLPELAGGIGQAVTEFRRGLRESDAPPPAVAAKQTVTTDPSSARRAYHLARSKGR